MISFAAYERAIFDALDAELMLQAQSATRAGQACSMVHVPQVGRMVYAKITGAPRPTKPLDNNRTGLELAQVVILQAALQEAVTDGYLVPGDGTETPSTNGAHHLNYMFTPRGLRHYGQPRRTSLRHSGALVQALQDLPAGAIETGQLAVLEEARACWEQGCYRATTVLIGVASEVSLRRLLDVLAGYTHRAAGGSTDWKKVDDLDPIKSIGSRFVAGLAILRRLEEAMQREANAQKKAASGIPPAWSELWWRSLDPLASIAETIRYARNAAAHDGEAPFRRSDVELLLATMPTTLGHIHELAEFLRNLEDRIGPGLPPKV